jgi:hypothetical protein
MAVKVLLVNPGHDIEQVGANNHTYQVVDGFCLVDVTPFRQTDPRADAAADAIEICKLPAAMPYGPPRFRAASPGEVQQWQQVQAAVQAQVAADEAADAARTGKK